MKRNLYFIYARSILKLSIPIIIGQLGFVLMGVADTVMVGHVSSEALAAAGVSNAIFFLCMVISIGIGAAISPMIARSHSASDHKAIKEIFVNGIWVSLITGIILNTIIAFLAFHFHWFRQPPEVERLSKEFTLILSYGAIPFAFFFFIKQLCDGLSETLYPMLITIFCLLMNIFLNWVFIYGNLGSPAMGLNGAGYATFLSRLMGVLLLCLLVWFKEPFRSLLAIRVPLFHKEHFVRILKVGLPSGLQYLFEVAAFSGSAFIIGWLGTVQLAAHNVALSIASVTYMIITGISLAASIKVGNALGQKNLRKVRITGLAAIGTGLSFMSIFCLILFFGRHYLAGLYTIDPNVHAYAVNLIVIAALFQLSDGTQAIGLGILRGISDVNMPTLVTLLAYWAVGLPLGSLLAFYFKMDVYGIWIALLAALSFAGIAHTWRFMWLTKKRKVEMES